MVMARDKHYLRALLLRHCSDLSLQRPGRDSSDGRYVSENTLRKELRHGDPSESCVFITQFHITVGVGDYYGSHSAEVAILVSHSLASQSVRDEVAFLDPRHF